MQTQGMPKRCSQEVFDQVADELGLSERVRFCAQAVVVHGAVLEQVCQYMRENRGDRVYPSQVSKWAALVRSHLPGAGEAFVPRYGCFRKWYQERVELADPVPDDTGRLRHVVVSARSLRADYERWAISQNPQAKEIAAPRFGALMLGTDALQFPVANVMHYRGIKLRAEPVVSQSADPASPWFYESEADPTPAQMAGRVEFALVPSRAAQMIDRETGRPIASSPAVAPAVAPGFAPTGLIVK